MKKWKWIVAAVLAAVVLAAVVIFLGQEEDPNEIVTVYCVEKLQFSGGQVITCGYDDSGRLVKIGRYNADEGYKAQEFRYDGDGMLQYYKDESGIETEFAWDAEKRTLTGRKNVGSDGGETTVYDENGNRLSCTTDYGQNADQPTEYAYWTYDESGNLVSYSYEEEGVLRQLNAITYDRRGNLLTGTVYLDDELNYSTERTYDSAGRVIYEKEYTTEDLASFGEKVEPRLAEHTFQYDKAGRMTLETVVYEGGREKTLTWDYDEQGRLCAHTNGDMSIEWSYDAAGNVASFQQSNYGTVSVHKEYSYVSFQVPRWQAEQILLMQRAFFDVPGNWLWTGQTDTSKY